MGYQALEWKKGNRGSRAMLRWEDTGFLESVIIVVRREIRKSNGPVGWLNRKVCRYPVQER